MTNQRSIVLLGSSGFIGKSLCPALERAWAGPVVTVSLDDEPRPGHVQLDLLAVDTAELRAMFERTNPAAVVNCTGALAGSHTHLVNLNMLAVANVVDALSTLDDARYLHIGSAAEYGPGLEGVLTSEDAPVAPTTPYGVTKLAATMLVRAASQAGEIDATVLRLFNPVGPGLPASSFLGSASEQMRRAKETGEESIALGSLDAYRDFIDCRDFAGAVVAVLRTPGASGEVFNVGRGKGVGLLAMLERLMAISGFDGRIETIGAGSSASTGVSWQAADITKLTTATGWIPRYSLDDALQSLWDGVSRRSVESERIIP